MSAAAVPKGTPIPWPAGQPFPVKSQLGEWILVQAWTITSLDEESGAHLFFTLAGGERPLVCDLNDYLRVVKAFAEHTERL